MFNSKRITIACCFAVLVLAAPWFAPAYTIALLITMLMYATLGVGWLILSGYVGYINLGAAGSFGLGVYCTAILWPHVPLPALIVCGAFAAGLLAAVLGMPALRVRGPYFVILTFGLSQLLLQMFTLYEAKIVKTVGTILMDAPSDKVLYMALAIVGICAVIAAHVIKHSKFGFGLFAIKGDEEAAEAMGVNTTAYKLLAFIISSAVMGAVGTILALRWTYIDPQIAFNSTISFQVAIMALLGGLGSYVGPIVGAVVLTGVSEAFGVKFPYHYLLILGFLVVVLNRYVPNGLQGLGKRIVASWPSRSDRSPAQVTETTDGELGG